MYLYYSLIFIGFWNKHATDGQPVWVLSQNLVWDYCPQSQPITSQAAYFLPLFELINILCVSYTFPTALRLSPYPPPSANFLLT